VIIISDAQRYDTMRFMPETQALIGDQGVMFTRAYATTPLCCPSRSSILTGLYAHNHQVRNNFDELSVKTIVQALHENGYRTALTGKYLNSYPVYLGPPLPEFDLWITYDKPTYYDPMLASAAHGKLSPPILPTFCATTPWSSSARMYQAMIPFCWSMRRGLPIYRLCQERTKRASLRICLRTAWPVSTKMICLTNRTGISKSRCCQKKGLPCAPLLSRGL
jgi:hypothetical protein